MSDYRIMQGDALTVLRTLPAESVQCVVTSPPYWGLRDYGHSDQLGVEPTPEEYVASLVAVFREVRRVLRVDGTVWLNLGDTYAANRGYQVPDSKWVDVGNSKGMKASTFGLKPKDLVGIPWRVAFALQADGWYLRQDIIWAKPNPMPESVTDRCTKAHEYVFLLTRSARYYYDAEAIKDPSTTQTGMAANFRCETKDGGRHAGKAATQHRLDREPTADNGSRNRRSVWTISTQPYAGAHFAVMPPDLVEPCILAGTSARGCCPECGKPWVRVVERIAMQVKPSPSRDERSQNGQLRTQTNGTMVSPPQSTTTGWKPACTCDAGDPIPCTVLDPFAGSGTTLAVAVGLGRHAIGIELNPEYIRLAEQRMHETSRPLFGL